MIFLKLGGSLITDKEQAETVRQDVLSYLCSDIAAFKQANPAARLLIGHGSGSFGHHEASKYGTQKGVHSEEDWDGYAKVWQAAQRLNHVVVDALAANNLPVITLSPSASAVCRDGKLHSLATEPIEHALDAGIVPVVHGDVAMDQSLGGTIVSTEHVFTFLAKSLQPGRILIAGREPGVLADPGEPGSVLESITGEALERLQFGAIAGSDVTGGMRAKVKEALNMAQASPDAEIYIFSPTDPGSLLKALNGGHPGTRILP